MYCKKMITRIQRHNIDMEKMFAHKSDIRLIAKIYKLLQCLATTKPNIIKQLGEELNRHFFKADTQMNNAY